MPSPDQKFVNIYRVIYHSIRSSSHYEIDVNPLIFSENSIRDESSVFKISKLDSPKKILVPSLLSGQLYQVRL